MSSRYLAIITYGRTGSTALQFAMNQSAGVVVRGENLSILTHFFHAFQCLVEAKASFGCHRRTPSEPWYGCDLWDEDAFLSGQRALVLEHILKPNPDTTVLGFKEIRYLQPDFASFEAMLAYLLYLDRLLPGIRFLINRREPQDAVKSGWWSGDSASHGLLTTAYDWLGRLGPALDEQLGRRASIRVEYEQWSADPMSLQPAWEFLGLPWHPVRMQASFSKRLNHLKPPKKDEEIVH